MRRMLLVATAMVVFVGSAALAQEPGEQVIARINLKAPDNKENPIFAEQGELMSVIEAKDNALLVKTAHDRRGWIRAADAIGLPKAIPVFDDLIKKEPQEPAHYAMRA